MTESTGHWKFALALSREEQWVLHHVMLDRMELEARSPEADAPSIEIYRVFKKLEAGTHRFTRRERRLLREELERYVEARDTPERDRPTARKLLDRLRQESGRQGRRTEP